MRWDLPLTRDVVLVGGGHTHALVLRAWGMNPLPGARLTLINPEPEAAYSGMLPGHVAGHYPRDALMIDLVRLARFAGSRLILGRAAGLDREARHIMVPGRPPIRYDVVSIDVGVTSEMPSLPGFTSHAHPAKPLAPFAAAWQAHAEGTGPRESVVIGGGVAGMELALAMAHRLGPGTVTVVEASQAALPGLSAGTRRAILREAARLGVTIQTGAPVKAAGRDSVTLADGTVLASAFTAGAAGASAHAWLQTTGLHTTEGFVTVDRTLRSVTDHAVFAVGDCAHLGHDPRPKAGVFAVRQAPILLHNLRAALTDGKPREYRPQRDYLKLISTGSKRAVADRSGLRAGGAWLWRWKDRIDRAFMNKFTELRPMGGRRVPAVAAKGVSEELTGQPACGGCAAKVGWISLSDALSALPAPGRPDTLSGPGDDAAVLQIGPVQQVITTDHLRAFTEDPWTMTRIAAVHSLGDIWAMGAGPQAALTQITLPPLAERLQATTIREILEAARSVFADAGADIVGGHTSTGAELTIGFTVTGLVKNGAVGQAGARPGDVLILTKPLGTGVLMAAEMQLKAKGEWVARALDSMMQSQHKAAAVLAQETQAMTDITGFGLAGHLMGILDASRVGASLKLDLLPMLPGVETLLTSGMRSTLHKSNAALRDRCTIPDVPRAEVLFDPQTAGGLLAAIPAFRAEAIVDRLRSDGYQAVAIGSIEAGEPTLRVT